MVICVLLQVKLQNNLRKVRNVLTYFFYLFILSQEENKYLLCTKLYSCDLSCRSGLNIKQTCPSSKVWMKEQEHRSSISSYALPLWCPSDNADSKSPQLQTWQLPSCAWHCAWPWVLCESKTRCLFSQKSQFHWGDKLTDLKEFLPFMVGGGLGLDKLGCPLSALVLQSLPAFSAFDCLAENHSVCIYLFFFSLQLQERGAPWKFKPAEKGVPTSQVWTVLFGA